MKITKKIKLQKQSTDGTISMTLPKQIATMKGWKPQDIVNVSYDTETGEITIYV